MKLPLPPSFSPSRPWWHTGHSRGSAPSARAGKKCAPKSSSSASITSEIFRSRVCSTARENSCQNASITARHSLRPPDMSSSCSSSAAVKPVST